MMLSAFRKAIATARVAKRFDRPGRFWSPFSTNGYGNILLNIISNLDNAAGVVWAAPRSGQHAF